MKRVAFGLFVAVLLTGCKVGDGLSERAGDADGPPAGDQVPGAQSGAPTPEAAQAADATAELPDGDPPLEPGQDPDDSSTADASATDPATADLDPAPAARTYFHFTRPEHIRGLYVNAWSAGSRRRLAALIELAQRTEINTFVIDIKDASGYVSHRTEVPFAHETGANRDVRIPSLARTLERLEEAGIYPIARIVIVKDPVLAAARPDLAVQDTAGGAWVDNKGIVWLNPYNREVWDYHIDLAREVAAMGVPEIQWDYVRFPDAPASVLARAHFPGRDGQPKTAAIRDFLAYSREELSAMFVRVTADVFGVTTSATHDVGIGQVWESFIDVVDVALPMVYPSHYWAGAFGFDRPNAYPYEIVRTALDDAMRRSALMEDAGTTRPWLQDFTLGEPRYGAPEVRAQIQAAYDVGIDEWVLWNPGSRYTEAALEPAGGFASEPFMRIANEIIPVSRRFELFDTTTVVVETEEEGAVKDTEEEGEGTTKSVPDTTRIGNRRSPGKSGSASR